jgi:hypothetical protein
MRKRSAQVIGKLARVLDGGDLGRVSLRVGHPPVVDRGESEAFRKPVQCRCSGADVLATAREIDEQVLQRILALGVVDIAADHPAGHGVRVGGKVVGQMNDGKLANLEQDVSLASREKGPIGRYASEHSCRSR